MKTTDEQKRAITDLLDNSDCMYYFIRGLDDLKCPTCRGGGTLDDGAPGDISCNTWQCPDCKGTGFKS